jgi:5-methylcytosine-specific restriction protein A
MKQIDTNNVIGELAENYGINLRGYSLLDSVDIRPTDIEYGVGFIIRIKLEWRSLSAEFIPDNFSAALLKKETFKLLAQKCTSNFNDFQMEINREVVNPLEPVHWSENWSHLYIKLLKSPIIRDDLTAVEIEKAIMDISGNLLGLILSLLPLEDVEFEDIAGGLPEGALTRIEVNRYERSSFNRQVCLRIHGSICKVCNFDFEEKYGDLGKGFIHVHHVVPVSELVPLYEINPEKDLVPVCPNCHAMIHKRNPPYSVEEIKKFVLLKMEMGKG